MCHLEFTCVKDIKATLNSFDWTQINWNVMHIQTLSSHTKDIKAILDSFDWMHITWYYLWSYILLPFHYNCHPRLFYTDQEKPINR